MDDVEWAPVHGQDEIHPFENGYPQAGTPQRALTVNKVSQ